MPLQFGIVPQELKIAKVIPVFKSVSKKDLRNYRPISVLPFLSKILEKLVHVIISKQIAVNNILYKHQYGFRKKNSTGHVLLQFVNKSYTKEEAKILINGTEIRQGPHTTFLAVVLDEGLNWNNQINRVCKRSMKMLGMLRKVCPLIHHSAHLTLYYSFLFPYMKDCNIVWSAIIQLILANY